MNRITHNGVVYYQFKQWSGLTHGVFTRKGGQSQSPWSSLNIGGTVGDSEDAVSENHRIIYETLDVNADRACTVWLVHGNETIVADGPVNGRRWIAKADGLITHHRDTPLIMRYADCVPLLFYDPKKEVIGLAHAGWRGTVQGVGSNLVKKMKEAYGSNPSDIQAGIGPSISGRNFQVGEEVVDAVNGYFGKVDGLIQRDPSDGTAYVDLWAANALDLRRAGVEQIEIAGLCTYDRTDEFYSHRAENGRTGRFGVVIAL